MLLSAEVARGVLPGVLDAEDLSWPGEDWTTDRQLDDFMRDTVFALYHPVGTCRMGADRDAVVDPTLRVRGIERLRVVDASIMPSIPRGNTNAPTIMIGERGADLVRHAT